MTTASPLPAEARGAARPRAELADLYRALKDELLTVAVQLAGERPAGEDLLHDVFVAFARRAPALPDVAAVRRYLVTSLCNRARDLKRRRAAPESDEPALAASPAADADPLPLVAADEEARRVHAALLTLPAEQRATVTLHLHGGLTFREIAQQSDLSINTVTSRYRYALQALQRKLAPTSSRSSP